MIEDLKNSEIILCSNIPIDKNYDNVLDISKANLVNYLRNNSEYVGDDYSIIPRYKNKLIVACPYGTAIKCNYMAFQNPDYDNEYVFAFVNNVEYVNDESSQINYTLDVWHTHHDKFSYNKVFVEREHVDDDTIGKHTIPEGLETGDFVINDAGEVLTQDSMYLTNTYIGLNKLPTGLPGNIYGGDYGGVYGGITYFMFDNEYDVGYFIKVMDMLGIGDWITTLFVLPKAMYNPDPEDIETWNITWNGVTPIPVQGYSVPHNTLPQTLGSATITRNSTLNGYTPKNNKLFTGDYNYLYITNNAGTDVKYNYEDFLNGEADFTCKGTFTIGGSIRLYPQKYKLFDCSYRQGVTYTGVEEYNYGISCAKYPTCSWSNDAYTNWLTQNATQLKVSEIQSELQLFTSFEHMTTMDYGSTVGGIGSGIGGILGNMLQKKMHSFTPNQSKGSVNSGDITLTTGAIGFFYQKMSIRYEYAQSIDMFFSRFGYQVNEIKQPTLHNRTKFDFIKVGGTDNLVSGKIPSNDLDEINAICRRGVTIFHDLTSFGDYLVNNPIVTP